MPTSLEKLQPADKRIVGIYLPYYNQQKKRVMLPRAITLYRQGNLEGERKIEGGENIKFVASWQVSSLPADLTRCRVQFDGNADLNYQMTITNVDFINFLIDLIDNYRRHQVVDFSKGFYRKLLQRND
jgi:hypothetical protein